jgi:uncharacterized protein
MQFEERAFSFLCQGSWLYGVISVPQNLLSSSGVLIVVGGPQYRAGSHRQFTLMARGFAEKGLAVMRFDVRGMGDSQGSVRTFEEINDDLRSAIDQFYLEVPAIKKIILWGLCDAATASSFYAHSDKRVNGLVLMNPWVRTKSGVARVYFKYYYLNRLFDPALWKNLISGKFNFFASLNSAVGFIKDLIGNHFKSKSTSHSERFEQVDTDLPLHERMYSSLKAFDGNVLIITSDNDLTAKEFIDLVKGSGKWQNFLVSSQVAQHNLSDADHTFSRRVWRDQVVQWTYDWIKYTQL